MIPKTEVHPAFCGLEYAEVTERLKARPLSELTRVVDISGVPQGPQMAVMHPFSGPPKVDALWYVRHLPTGNRLSDHQLLQSRQLTEYAEAPVITVTSPCQGSGFEFSPDCGKRGDFGDYTRQVAERLQQIAPKMGRMGVLGWSQGAAMAATHGVQELLVGSGRRVEWVVAGEPSTVMARGFWEFMGDFNRSGSTGDLYDTLQQSGLGELFMQAHGVSNTRNARAAFGRKVAVGAGWESLRDFMQFLGLIKGLGKKTLPLQLRTLVSREVPVILARARNSYMCPEDALDEGIRDALGGAQTVSGRFSPSKYVQHIEVVGNHTSGDHMPLIAHLASRATNLAQFLE